MFRKGLCEAVLQDGWTQFSGGECLYFHFKNNKLSMHRVQKNQTYVIDGGGINTQTTKYYFHTKLVSNGTSMTFGSLNAEECKVFEQQI